MTHTLAPQTGYATGGTRDEFICFVLEPETTETTYLTGLSVEPGVAEVVHHAVLTLDATGASRDLAGPDGQYECFGSSGVNGGTLGGFTPAAPPFELPEGTGLEIPAGSAIVMQIHYHPTGPIAPVDVTQVNLRLTTTRPDRLASFTFFGNVESAPILQPGPNDRAGVEFRIPADVPDHTETMRFVVPGDPNGDPVPLWSFFAHMHYVGVDLEITVERQNPGPGQPSEECLSKITRYDFDWQRLYSYDREISELPTVRGGDIITLKCTYDNTMDNPKVVEGLIEQNLPSPIDVFLGEESLDEMCIGLVGAITP